MDEKDCHTRPSIIWMDVRAADQSRRIGEPGDPALEYNGYWAVSAEWMPSKALWLEENEPETYNNAKRLCECQDWMTHKLTGEWTASISNTSIRWYYYERTDKVDRYVSLEVAPELGQGGDDRALVANRRVIRFHRGRDMYGNLARLADGRAGRSSDLRL
jgi:ribulose kinase